MATHPFILGDAPPAILLTGLNMDDGANQMITGYGFSDQQPRDEFGGIDDFYNNGWQRPY